MGVVMVCFGEMWAWSPLLNENVGVATVYLGGIWVWSEYLQEHVDALQVGGCGQRFYRIVGQCAKIF